MTCGLFSGFVLGGRRANTTVDVGRTAITALFDLIGVSCTCHVITPFFLSLVLPAALAEATIAYGMICGINKCTWFSAVQCHGLGSLRLLAKVTAQAYDRVLVPPSGNASVCQP